MNEIEMFRKYFFNLGEMCFQIHMVERPKDIIDFTGLEKQSINEDYLIKIRARYPKVIKGFFLSMKRRGEGVQIFLTDSFNIIVEYVNPYDGEKIEKTETYSSLGEARKNQPGFINYLTRSWNPIEKQK